MPKVKSVELCLQLDLIHAVLPRIARLMALAIHFDKLIQSGVVTNYAELARLGNVTRARVTQIMNLLMLAPEIQEELLFLPRLERGRGEVCLRDFAGPGGGGVATCRLHCFIQSLNERPTKN